MENPCKTRGISLQQFGRHPELIPINCQYPFQEVIQCSDARQLEKIRCRYFEDIEKVAVHPLGNFALQKLLTAWTDKETVRICLI